MSKHIAKLTIGLAMILIGGCAKKVVLTDEVYDIVLPRSAPNLSSSIILARDGTFEQTVQKKWGTEVKLVGHWRQVERAVDFDQLLFLVDLDDSKWLDSPREVGQVTGTIDGDFIIFRENTGFLYHRRSHSDR